MATRKVLAGLMQLLASPEHFAPGLILKVLRTIKHLCMGEARHMDELQRAKALLEAGRRLAGDEEAELCGGVAV